MERNPEAEEKKPGEEEQAYHCQQRRPLGFARGLLCRRHDTMSDLVKPNSFPAEIMDRGPCSRQRDSRRLLEVRQLLLMALVHIGPRRCELFDMHSKNSPDPSYGVLIVDD